MTNAYSGRIDETEHLVETLKRIPRVVSAAARRGGPAEAEAWQIATALGDIQESMNRLFFELVPKLRNVPPTDEIADELLNEIGRSTGISCITFLTPRSSITSFHANSTLVLL